MSLGYHVTTWEAWTKIQAEGLVPQPLWVHQQPITWLWDQQPEGRSLLGILVDKMLSKDSTRLVLIEVDYWPEEQLMLPGSLTHDGVIHHGGGPKPWIYHSAKPVTLLLKPIPPDRLCLLREFDLLEAFCGPARHPIPENAAACP